MSDKKKRLGLALAITGLISIGLFLGGCSAASATQSPISQPVPSRDSLAITGTVAIGAPIQGAVVTASCGVGVQRVTVNARTGSDGTYSITVSGGNAATCRTGGVRVVAEFFLGETSIELFSALPPSSSGTPSQLRVHVTPFSDAAVRLSIGVDAAVEDWIGPASLDTIDYMEIAGNVEAIATAVGLDDKDPISGEFDVDIDNRIEIYELTPAVDGLMVGIRQPEQSSGIALPSPVTIAVSGGEIQPTTPEVITELETLREVEDEVLALLNMPAEVVDRGVPNEEPDMEPTIPPVIPVPVDPPTITLSKGQPGIPVIQGSNDDNGEIQVAQWVAGYTIEVDVAELKVGDTVGLHIIDPTEPVNLFETTLPLQLMPRSFPLDNEHPDDRGRSLPLQIRVVDTNTPLIFPIPGYSSELRQSRSVFARVTKGERIFIIDSGRLALDFVDNTELQLEINFNNEREGDNIYDRFINMKEATNGYTLRVLPEDGESFPTGMMSVYNVGDDGARGVPIAGPISATGSSSIEIGNQSLLTQDGYYHLVAVVENNGEDVAISALQSLQFTRDTILPTRLATPVLGGAGEMDTTIDLAGITNGFTITIMPPTGGFDENTNIALTTESHQDILDDIHTDDVVDLEQPIVVTFRRDVLVAGPDDRIYGGGEFGDDLIHPTSTNNTQVASRNYGISIDNSADYVIYAELIDEANNYSRSVPLAFSIDVSRPSFDQDVTFELRGDEVFAGENPIRFDPEDSNLELCFAIVDAEDVDEIDGFESFAFGSYAEIAAATAASGITNGVQCGVDGDAKVLADIDGFAIDDRYTVYSVLRDKTTMLESFIQRESLHISKPSFSSFASINVNVAIGEVNVQFNPNPDPPSGLELCFVIVSSEDFSPQYDPITGDVSFPDTPDSYAEVEAASAVLGIINGVQCNITTDAEIMPISSPIGEHVLISVLRVAGSFETQVQTDRVYVAPGSSISEYANFNVDMTSGMVSFDPRAGFTQLELCFVIIDDSAPSFLSSYADIAAAEAASGIMNGRQCGVVDQAGIMEISGLVSGNDYVLYAAVRNTVVNMVTTNVERYDIYFNE